MISLTLEGTCFSAKRPLVMEFASTGSVGVTAAATARDSKKVKPGIKAQTRRAVENQAQVITNPSKTVIERASFLR